MAMLLTVRVFFSCGTCIFLYVIFDIDSNLNLLPDIMASDAVARSKRRFTPLVNGPKGCFWVDATTGKGTGFYSL